MNTHPKIPALIGASLVAAALGGSAASAKASNSASSYTLSADALQDVEAKTDITYQVRVAGQASAPTVAYAIFLSSRDADGQPVTHVRLYESLERLADGKSSAVTLAYHDIGAHQDLTAEVLVPTFDCSGASTPLAELICNLLVLPSARLLRTDETVLLRPDLALETLTIPAALVQGHRAKLSVLVGERNGDLDATADVYLERGDIVLDVETGVAIAAGSTVEVDLVTVLEEAGAYDLTVEVVTRSLADYDGQNNTITREVAVKTVSEHLAANEDLDYLFDLDSLPALTLVFTPDDWNAQLEHYDQNPRHEEKVAARFRFEKDGLIEELPQVGFRIRGNVFSRRRLEGAPGEAHDLDTPDWHMAHMRIDFRYFDDSQRFHDARALILKFFKDDATYVREVFALDLLRRFDLWTAPRSSYVRVFVEVEDDPEPAYFGVYQMMEAIDKEFIQDRFDKKNDDGFLFKCTYGNTGPADMLALPLDSGKIGVEDISLDESESIRPTYDLKTNKGSIDEARAKLVDFLTEVESREGADFESWIRSKLDVDQFLRYLAANVALGMWDDYWVNANNYYLYFDERERVHVIPYDYDNVLGTSHLVDNSGTRDALRWGVTKHRRPLIDKVLQVPELRADYRELLLALVDEEDDLASFEPSVSRIYGWYDLIDSFIDNDTGENTEIADIPAWWANAPFYRLLTGDQSGAPPEANFFTTKASSIAAHVCADQDWVPGAVVPITADLHLRGSYNGWDANEDSRMAVEGSVYWVQVYLTRQIHDFKIADTSWSRDANFGAPYHYSRADPDDPLLLSSQYLDPTIGNFSFAATEAGRYEFVFDGRDQESAFLTITLIEADPTPEPIAGYGVDVYLRGGFNGWAIDPDWALLQDAGDGNLYQRTVALEAGDHEFKIADVTWGTVNLGGGAAGATIALATPISLVNGGDPPNLQLALASSGEYTFRLNATDPANPVLTVSQE